MLLARVTMWVALLHAHAAHTTHPTHTHLARGHTFTLGYLTGSERLPEDQEYKRPGLLISGAITLAVEEVSEACFRRKYIRVQRGDEVTKEKMREA